MYKIKLFKKYVKINTIQYSNRIKTNYTWKYFFINNLARHNLSLFFTKFFIRWKTIFNLLYSLLYYEVNIIFFGNVFFKKELLAINWYSNNKLFNIWRYFNVFLFSKIIKINTQSFYILNKIKLLNFKIVFILDIIYHIKTLNFLKKNNFYIIGAVPINLNLYCVDLAIPILSENIFNQLFFIKLIINIKKNIQLTNYSDKKNIWFKRNINYYKCYLKI